MVELMDKQYQEGLVQKWGAVLDAGESITDEQKRISTAMVLESTQKDFEKRGLVTEEAGMGTGIAGDGSASTGVLGPNDYHWPSIVIPTVRRIFPQLMAHELVGVQPMTAPIGFAFALRAKYGTNGQLGVGNLDQSGNEIGYNTVDTRYTGVSGLLQGTEASASTDQDYWKSYFGTSNTEWRGQGQVTANGEYAQVNNDYPMAKFDLIKAAVEAKSRKLAANWSPELAEDMMAMHGIDVDGEMINILTYEVGAEIDRQMLTEMVKSAITGGKTSTWTPVSADGRNQLERIGTLMTQINEKTQDIATATRRGSANFCITSPSVTAVLQRLNSNAFVANQGATMPSLPATGVGSLVKVGLINDGTQLLVRDTFAQGDYAMLGYKGSSPWDAGIIYSPYIPLQLMRATKDADFTPEVGVRTRYGVMGNVWGSENYYQFIAIEDMKNTTLAGDGSRVFTY
jgi:hypothetical protein